MAGRRGECKNVGGRGNINLTATRLNALISKRVEEEIAAHEAARNQNRLTQGTNPNPPHCTFNTFLDCKPPSFDGKPEDGRASQNLCQGCSLVTWSANLHHFGSRRSVHFQLLDSIAKIAWWSSATETTIAPTSKLRPMRHSMVGNADHLSIGREKTESTDIGPFEILKRIGPVAYQLNLPTKLDGVHNVFHVSNRKKCLSDETLVIPLDEIQVDERLRFVGEPVEIMDREVKRLKQSRIPIARFRWNSKRGPEFTRECEDQMMRKYPHLFKQSTSNADNNE
ncbi:hypothetical protein E3N88_23346 [Mikania micrantha]|uniref:Tf2-1-like SH3-like domain-containing protein n=1 Tax=Mikania micrantha TaxID=192012 RepID=A0A5N6NFL6_9ASTR|nr:hypothetical protein E3N88_23346 [Mikania micrantha]